jgi:hypothetical protein
MSPRALRLRWKMEATGIWTIVDLDSSLDLVLWYFTTLVALGTVV